MERFVENAFMVIIFVVCVGSILATILIGYAHTEQSKLCSAMGGVYVDGTCFDKKAVLMK